MLLYIVLFFIFGVSIGSFLSVVIDRLPRGKQLVTGRSACDSCKKELTPIELIPIISYVKQRGVCRSCKKPIGKRPLLIEVLTGMLFSGVILYSTFVPLSLVSIALLCGIVSCFVILFFVDLEHGILPDKVVLEAFIFTLVLHLDMGNNLFPFIVAGLITGSIFLVLFLVTKGKGMGFGDVKLAVLIGFLLGLQLGLFALYLSFLTGAIVSLILVAWGKKKFKKSTIPFGPFLIFSTCVMFVWGDAMLSFILSKLLS